MSENILELKNVTKSFPGVKAIDDISLTVKRGTVHVIVGENGAGKSTLMKIINGMYKPDAGEIIFDDTLLGAYTPKMARDMGIAMIYQELNIIPEMTVAENIYLGREPTRKFKTFIHNKKLNKQSAEYLKSQKLNIKARTKMKDLTVSQAQIIEIIKAITCNAKLIIMDEPTSAITESETEYLFEKIRELKAQGVSIIYISHKLDEIFKIADHISVFRDGRHIKTGSAGEFNKNSIITLMVGREMSNIYPKEEVEIAEEAFRVEGLTSKGVFSDINFSVRYGEILGFAGLMGAGRSEIVRAIFGLDKKDGGRILMGGKEVVIKSVNDAIENGIIMLSENRRKYGLIPIRSVRENIMLAALKYMLDKKFIRHRQEKKIAQEMVARLSIKTPSLNATVANLSGGNQQKAVLAKWLLIKPKVLILDEPTRGIDVGAKYEIYKIMGRLAKEGIAIIMISSELPELLGISDRIAVIRGGRLVGEIKREEATQESVMRFAAGGESNE